MDIVGDYCPVSFIHYIGYEMTTNIYGEPVNIEVIRTYVESYCDVIPFVPTYDFDFDLDDIPF